MVCTGFAFGFAPTKAAVLTGAKGAKSHIRLGGSGFNAFTPSKQILNGDGFAAWLRLDAGLVDGHTHLFNGVAVNRCVAFQSTEGVKPHLCVALCRYRYAFAVLIVGNVEGIATDHNAIAGTKALRYIFGKINPHLNGNIWLCIVLHSSLG